MKKQIAFLVFTVSFPFFTYLNAQNINTVVGNVVSGGPFGGYSGDGGPATSAEVNAPYGIAFDAVGNMFIADDANNVVRKVDYLTGITSTVVGNTTSGGPSGGGYSGDGGPATAAEIHGPACIAFDASGNMIFGDADNYVIRKVDHSTGNISTIVGNHTNGYYGDGGAATAAELSYPTGIVLDGTGNLYIADRSNCAIRKVDNSSGIISTYGGNHVVGYSGDGGAATNAKLYSPTNIVIDHAGNIFFTDYGNNIVREILNGTGIINTVAGNHTYGAGYSGDGGVATNAELFQPWGITLDALGNFFIADQFNSLIRKVDHSTNVISTVAGNYNGGVGGYSGDGGPATDAELLGPTGIALDSYGNLFISDNGNNVIREVNSVTIGINEVKSISDGINIYPNPSNGVVFITLSHPELIQGSQNKLEVYNIFGTKIYSQNNIQSSKFNLDLSAVSNGVYFLKIITPEGIITKQFVKEK